MEDEIEGDIVMQPSNEMNRLLAVKDLIKSKLHHMKPWKKFLNVNEFSKPKDFAEASKRVSKNFSIYQANYLVICLLLVIYSIITSPLLLVGFFVMFGGLYCISRQDASSKLKLFGKELSIAQQYSAVFLISIPFLFLASAGSVLFWVIGASAFVILFHASFWQIAEEQDTPELDSIKIFS